MIRYREVQHFHPLLYAGLCGMSALFGVLAAVRLAEGVPTGECWLSFGLAATPLMVIALAGRVVLTVSDSRLAIDFGWLGGAHKEIDLNAVDSARVCASQPYAASLGLGWRGRPDGASRSSVRSRRGLEIVTNAGRTFISSVQPQQLKIAILGCQEPDQDGPGALRKEPIRQRSPRRLHSRFHDWGLISPREMEGIGV